MAKAGKFLEEIAAKVGKEVNSVRGKALSLLRSGQISELPKQRDHVEAAVDPIAELMSDFPSLTVDEIAEKLDKTPRGVKVMLTRRQLKAKGYDEQDERGAFVGGNGMMYGHGITTLLLAEVAGMTAQDVEVRQALQRAVDLILRSQQVEKSSFYRGGWRYHPESSDSDLSVTVWQILALKAASDVGIKVPAEAIDRAMEFVGRCEPPQGGFGYQPGGLSGIGRTAGALLVDKLVRGGGGNETIESRTWLKRATSSSHDAFYYYAAHNMAHLGFDYGKAALLEKQNPDGSWTPVPAASPEGKAGPLYATAVAVLALTADQHYLPVYLR